MKKYIAPEMKIVEFDCEDIITTSSATLNLSDETPTIKSGKVQKFDLTSDWDVE